MPVVVAFSRVVPPSPERRLSALGVGWIAAPWGRFPFGLSLPPAWLGLPMALYRSAVVRAVSLFRNGALRPEYGAARHSAHRASHPREIGYRVTFSPSYLPRSAHRASTLPARGRPPPPRDDPPR